MCEIIIKVTKEGEVIFLYDDQSPLRDMGKMILQRASNVVWNEQLQSWQIKLPSGFIIGGANGYRDRVQAIAAEIEILNEMLNDGYEPEDVGFGLR
jgi:hypothetical protein